MTPAATAPPAEQPRSAMEPAARFAMADLRRRINPSVPGWQSALGVAFGVLIATLTGRPLQGALLALAVPFTLVTSLRTKVCVYLVILPLIGGLKYQFPATDIQGVPDLIELTMLFHIGFELITARARIPIRHPLVLLVLGFIAFILLQSQAPLARSSGFGISGARVFLEPMVLFLAGLFFWRDPDSPRLFFRISVWVGLFVGLYMLRQLIFGLSPNETAFLTGNANFTAASEGYLFSTLLSTGIYGFVTFLLMVTCIAARATGSAPRRLATIVAAISALGIFTSGARISMFAAVPAGAMMIGLVATSPGGRRFARRLTALGIAALIVLIALVALTPVQDRRASANARNPLDSTINKLAMLKAGSSDDDVASRTGRFALFSGYITRHPWGAGTGVINLVNNARQPQAGFLRVAPPLPPLLRDKPWIFQHDFYYFAVGVELGLLPLLMFVGILLLGMAFAIGGRKGEPDPNRRMVLNVAAASTAFVMLHVLTNESFRAPQVAGYVWLLLAAPVAFVSLRRPALLGGQPAVVRGTATAAPVTP